MPTFKAKVRNGITKRIAFEESGTYNTKVKFIDVLRKRAKKENIQNSEAFIVCVDDDSFSTHQLD
jgi:hypothetical protein